MQNNHKTLVLCILDGWGIGKHDANSSNAILQAKTPNWDFLLNNFPHTQLETSGEAIGLPKGQMGNSEVGHMTIGSGRVIFQDLVRINQAIKSNELAKNPHLIKLIHNYQNSNKSIHLLGLCSDGGVHSHIDHLLYLAKLLADNHVQVRLHLFLDGRDVLPTSADKFLSQIDTLLLNPNIKISTLMGRFYSMDRDNRWERCELAYRAIAEGLGNNISNWKNYLQEQYQKNIYDEFIAPAVFNGFDGINDGDSLIFTNFRSDRIRQIAHSLVDDNFQIFKTKKTQLQYKIGMTQYSEELNKKLDVLFLEQKITNTLGEIISNNKMRQLRVAETEKYAHVTFFFNGGREEPYLGEERILVPSPKVHTYDLTPAMSAYEITNKVLTALDSKSYSLIIVNYANADMVGHCGKIDPAVKAVEVIDTCIGKIYQKIEQQGDILIISADHGNVEQMFDHNNQVNHTSHTTNPVPFLLVGHKAELEMGNLSNIAPTILEIMNIAKPEEITGKSLIKRV